MHEWHLDQTIEDQILKEIITPTLMEKQKIKEI